MDYPSGFEVDRFRSYFPSLADGTWSFFDGPGGTQTPAPVGDAIAQALTQPLSNRGVTSIGARNAERIVTECRTAVGDLLGVESASIAGLLGEQGIAVGAGSFYCDEATRHLGLGDAGAVRVGLAPYCTERDVARLLDALSRLVSS